MPNNFLCDTCINNNGKAKGYDKDIDPNRDFDINCCIFGDMDKCHYCSYYKS